MSDYLIQDITASDYFEQIYKVMQAAYTVEAQLLGVEDFYPLKRTAKAIASSSNQFIACFRQGKLVGVCELENLGNNSILIASTVVKPHYFRRGIASSLLEHVLNMRNFDVLFVSTAEQNAAAVRLYQKYGFTVYNSEMLEDGMKLIKLRFTHAA